MAKYFLDERKLPFPIEKLPLGDVDAPRLKKLLDAYAGKVSVCVRFKGLQEDCLGYVFNIRQTLQGFEISDITEKVLFAVGSLPDLADMIRHVSGGKYDTRWQQHFQVLRNQIASRKEALD